MSPSRHSRPSPVSAASPRGASAVRCCSPRSSSSNSATRVRRRRGEGARPAPHARSPCPPLGAAASLSQRRAAAPGLQTRGQTGAVRCVCFFWTSVFNFHLGRRRLRRQRRDIVQRRRRCTRRQVVRSAGRSKNRCRCRCLLVSLPPRRGFDAVPFAPAGAPRSALVVAGRCESAPHGTRRSPPVAAALLATRGAAAYNFGPLFVFFRVCAPSFIRFRYFWPCGVPAVRTADGLVPGCDGGGALGAGMPCGHAIETDPVSLSCPRGAAPRAIRLLTAPRPRTGRPRLRACCCCACVGPHVGQSACVLGPCARVNARSCLAVSLCSAVPSLAASRRGPSGRRCVASGGRLLCCATYLARAVQAAALLAARRRVQPGHD